MAKKEETILSEILEKIDPMEATIMILGGTAAVNGIIPPMTRLLLTFVGGDATTSGNVTKDIAAAQLLTLAGVPLGIPGIFVQMLAFTLFKPDQNQLPVEEDKAKVAALGLFCSGAIEAMIMYKLVSNPEVFKALIQLPGQVLQGAGSLIPQVPLV
jgi:hypothetical protein